jgi:RNA polymerase primary sigma factor
MASRTGNAARQGSGETDIVRRYLEEIGAHPLLNAADEQRLGAAIAAGRAAEAELADAAHLGPAKRRALQHKVDEAAQARRTFVQANLRLVVSVARRYEGSGLALLDLVQEGNLGLMRAVDRFDHRKGFKFSTYATWWIRQAIGRAIADSSRTIRVPAHVREQYGLIDQATARLAERFDRAPTDEEVAADCGLSVERVTLVRRHRRPLVSLAAPVGEDGDTVLADLLADDEAESPFDAAATALEREALETQLARLNPREQIVLRARFGLDARARTLAELGEELDITRERVRQIEAKALGKLRHPSLARTWTGEPRSQASG